MKEAALAKTSPYSGKSSLFQPHNLLEFLNSLQIALTMWGGPGVFAGNSLFLRDFPSQSELLDIVRRGR